MATTITPFIALYLAVFLLLTGIGLLGTYLPLTLTTNGTQPQVVGLVMSCYFVGMLVGSFVCQRLIRSVGHIRAFAAFAALTTAVVMLHGLHMSPLFWALLRFLCGISSIGLYMVIESWLGECTMPHLRGRVLAIYMVMSYLGMAVGQQLLNFGNAAGLQLFYIVGLMLVLCLVPVSVTHSIHPQLPRFTSFSPTRLFRQAPTGMLGCFSAGLLNSAFYAIAPVFCHQIGLSVSEMTVVMTVTILGGMLLQMPMGTISDNYDRTYVLALLGLTISLLSVLVFLFAKTSFLLLLILMGFFGGFIFTLYPIAVARAHDLFDPEDIVPVSSVLLLAYGTGASIGPVLASSIIELLDSPYGLFAYCATVALSYSLITYVLRRKQIVAVIPADENATFVAMKNSSPVAATMTPIAGEALDAEAAALAEEQAHSAAGQ